MKTILMTALAVLATSQPAIAQSVQADLAKAQRIEVISKSDVWTRPSWMAADLSISPTFDIRKAPEVQDTQGLLEKDTVHCLMTHEYATQDRGLGLSPKFNCDLMKVGSDGKLEVVRNSKNKPVKLKVKYSINTFGMPGVKVDSNPEVQAEIMATRLFTALGFTADRMFGVKNLKCYGCSNDPWNVRVLDQTSLTNPRNFTRVSVEFKAAGDAIEVGGVEGWEYGEVANENSFAKDRSLAREQLLERQALFILGGMLQHADNKASNHRILCDGKLDERGQCAGQVRLMIQDLGFTFGGGTRVVYFPGCFPYCSSKADLKLWKKTAMWWDEANRNACTINMGLNFAWKQPVVTEEARLFVARLLRKFVEGPAGYSRLIGLFESADLEAAGRGKATDWAKAFIEKVEEIENPALSDNNDNSSNSVAGHRYRDTREERAQHPAITCPNRLDNVLEKILRKQR